MFKNATHNSYDGVTASFGVLLTYGLIPPIHTSIFTLVKRGCSVGTRFSVKEMHKSLCRGGERRRSFGLDNDAGQQHHF